MYKLLLIDRAVFYVLGVRLVNSLAGLLTIFFILKFLSLDSQGHYYTFINLAGFSVFFEFGLSTLILQYVSHHMEKLSFSSSVLEGEDAELNDLLIFIGNVLRLGSILSLVMFLTLSIIGGLIFSWDRLLLLPWVLFVFLTSLNFVLNLMVNVVEGAGKISEIAKIRFFASLLSAPVMWALIAAGVNVYALSGQVMISCLIVGGWLFIKYKQLFWMALLSKAPQKLFTFIRSIFPLQSKLSLSFLSNFIGTQAMVPIAFMLGYVEFSGRLGMTLQALNALSGFAITWVNSKLPIFGTAVARGNHKQAWVDFERLAKLSFVILIFLLSIFLAVIIYLNFSGSMLATRFFSIELISLMLIAVIANHIYSSINVYLLAFKKDYLFQLNLYRGLFFILGFVVLLIAGSPTGLVYLYLLSSVLFGAVGSLFMLKKFNRTLC